ncbi:hypothetical protein Smar_0453 [Staphylothermus marinus F1]|uniref:Uncharacterized protein n=1 Tax=Staphylothermus marinus (strain ATCC 43588 / DSM 3639 / JCM 9404 / F1) TaxID=399550 RepID=A3DLQ4_STAMF|nr:hypothetical protein Smar_0453 [Staphylothermus marinus F1]
MLIWILWLFWKIVKTMIVLVDWLGSLYKPLLTCMVNGMQMKGSKWSWWSPDSPLNEGMKPQPKRGKPVHHKARATTPVT